MLALQWLLIVPRHLLAERIMKSNVSRPWFSDVGTTPVQGFDPSASRVLVELRGTGSAVYRRRRGCADGVSAQILSLPGGGSLVRQQAPARGRDAEPHETLGRFPEVAVAALADLGLSDAEMARYFRVERAMITGLRRHGEAAIAETGCGWAIEA